MKVHIIKRQTIEDYISKNARSKSSFEIRLSILKRANWKKPSDIVFSFNSADIIGKNSKRVIFNISGNNYRVIYKYLFGETKIHLFINMDWYSRRIFKIVQRGKAIHYKPILI